MADLVTWDNIKDELALDNAMKGRTERLISWISARAETIAGRKLTSEERTQYLPGTGTSRLILPVWPVTELASLIIDTTHQFDGDAVSSDEYFLDSDTGIVHFYNRAIPLGINMVKVVYTAGWTEATLPGDVLQACIEAISWNMQREGDRAFGVKNQTTPDGVNVGYEMVLPMGVQKTFESYGDKRV